MNTRVLDGQIITNRLDDVRAYDGVRTRRVFAVLIDYVIVALLTIPFAIVVFLLGLLTLGLGWVLFSVLVPAVAVLYIWNTLGSADQATTGMKMMGVRLDRLDGHPGIRRRERGEQRRRRRLASAGARLIARAEPLQLCV